MKIVLTPDWFLGKDVLIDAFSFIVLFIFSFLCFKNYKLKKNKKFIYLGGGFALIALAQLATIMTKLVLYYDSTLTRTIGEIIVTYHVVKSVDIFYHLGFFFYRFLTLLGFYIIYKLPIKKRDFEDFFLALFFITLLSILSKDKFHLFYLTALVLLILITKKYCLVYDKNKSKNTMILIFAFALLALSNIIFTFSGLSEMYVTANFLELVSYITLLILIMRILKHGTEKKQNGYYLRHARDNPK